MLSEINLLLYKDQARNHKRKECVSVAKKNPLKIYRKIIAVFVRTA
jgi:hypothetical protein